MNQNYFKDVYLESERLLDFNQIIAPSLRSFAVLLYSVVNGEATAITHYVQYGCEFSTFLPYITV